MAEAAKRPESLTPSGQGSQQRGKSRRRPRRHTAKPGLIPSFAASGRVDGASGLALATSLFLQRRLERDRRGRERPREDAAGLGLLRMVLERGVIEVGHIADDREIDTRDQEALVILAEVNVRRGVDAGRHEARLGQRFASAIEKQPAWAAPTSSSGLAPGLSSKREVKE